jgi:hypothetical protein
MEAEVAALAAQLEGSGLGDAMRGGVRNLYAAVNLAHVFGVILLVGGIGVVDLRVIGFGRRLPLGPLSRLLTPLALAGLLIQAVSGFMLLAADAGPLSLSWVFRAKLALIGFALLNALLFRRLFGDLDNETPPPLARTLAALSIAAWLGVVGLGRWIAYV